MSRAESGETVPKVDAGAQTPDDCLLSHSDQIVAGSVVTWTRVPLRNRLRVSRFPGGVVISAASIDYSTYDRSISATE
jgi:hypothetical protein